MARVAVPFLGGAYEASSLLISAQEAVNCYLEVGKDAANQLALRGVPGATEHGTLTDVRAMKEAFGKLYVVAGSTAYTVSSGGIATALGTVADDGQPACISFNIFEVLIVSGGKGYTVQRDTGVFAEIPSFPDTSHCGFINGYLVLLEKNSGRFRWTEVNDAETVSGLNFATAEGAPDDLVGLLVDHLEIVLFGERSIERWYNDGATPFRRVPNGFSERGCRAGFSPAKIDNTVFWLGDDLTVYRLAEGRPQRVSNHGIEQLIEKVGTPEDAIGLAYSQDGHAFYQLNFPGVLTITYDAATQTWHTRKLYNRVDCGYSYYAEAHGNRYVAGKKLWKLSDSVYEFSGPLERIRAVGPIKTGKRFSRLYAMTFLFETGSSDSYLNPQNVFLEISDDGGRTFHDRIEAEFGVKAQYTQEVKFLGLGGMYDNERVVKLTLTDPSRFTLVEAYADIA